MNANSRRVLERTATWVRGTRYEIDSNLPLSVAASYIFRRVYWVLRGTIRLLLLQQRFTPVFMASRVELRNCKTISFGHFVCLERGVFIDGLAVQGVNIGRNVTIGRNSIIRATGVLSNIGVGFRIGDRSSMDAFCFVGAAGGVDIGADVIMGQHVSFHAEEHVIDRTDIPIKNQGTTRRGITIGDDCWVGANVTFLDGCRVGRGCVIGAGAVVRGDIPDYSIAVGVPAKVVRGRTAANCASEMRTSKPS